ncbi:helix-turn-helix domain-containing protein [Anaerocolumna sedimenticola]|uniref:Helix-turn-helix domain-containing protein n=1 Tax=Anaerocolumna sedimenticola TaxID=2696063 RepID=A0A6P1TJ06_9FIRM|nr:helix-turn-helix transcriptional regulator [Anaerocolumna sedimenticola]QHQ59615.1 helix-turn-helix domain-containing protein [Anaerocolumna sedimenticola]
MKRRKLTPLGAEIKKCLIDKQMTQKELAKKIGVSPKYIHLILYGERSGKKYIPAIVSFLGLDFYIFDEQKKW